jgi:hypothetical protein
MPAANDKPTRPERWSVDARNADVATLVIPADARRERRFEIHLRFAVSARAPGARHGLRVEVNGAMEWQRSADTHPPADSLDYHFRREVPVGRPLKVVAKTEVQGAMRLSLRIEADEDASA